MAEETTSTRSACCGGDCGGGGNCDFEGECKDCSPSERGWRWLESTVALQREAYGFEWHGDESAGEIASSLKDNLLAAMVELSGEVPREFHWKYWSHTEPFVNRVTLLYELVDVLHFIANMLIAIGVDDEELEIAYKAKQKINRQRQADKYVAAQGKEV